MVYLKESMLGIKLSLRGGVGRSTCLGMVFVGDGDGGEGETYAQKRANGSASCIVLVRNLSILRIITIP